jgi:hypothetical protein
LPDVDSNLASIGDANLRQDLANDASGSGAALVSMEGGPSVEVAVLDRVIRVTSIAAMEAYSAPVGYVFSLNAGGRSGVFDVIAGDFSAELAADAENGIYVGLADDQTATTKVARRRETKIEVQHFGATGDGVTNDAPAIQSLIDYTEVDGGGYVYIPTFKENYKLEDSLKFMLGDIRIFGDKGAAFTHPFKDGTDRGIRKGNLIGATSAPTILDLGDFATNPSATVGEADPYPLNPARNMAMAWTVDHLTMRGEGSKQVDGISFTGVQNGPHRMNTVDTVSGYSLKNCIYVPVRASDTTIQLSNLNVTNCSFNFSDKAVLSDGGVYGASFINNNFEACGTGAIHGIFNGAVSVTGNMLENTKNPINLEPSSSMSLTAGGNYFEYHPTSDYLYRVRGSDTYLSYTLNFTGDIYSGGIPDYSLVVENAGRFNITSPPQLLIDNIPSGESIVIGNKSTIFRDHGALDIDRLNGTILAYVDGGFGRPDLEDIAIHSYPHDPATTTIEQTPLGPMAVVDLNDGIRVDYGETVQGKLILSTFMIRSDPSLTVEFPPSKIQGRTYAGQYLGVPVSPLDYVANDISQGEWQMVSFIWVPTSNVSHIEYHTGVRGYKVAGVVSQVLGAYVGDGTDPIKKIEPFTLNAGSSGSNINGSWKKHSDGTLECWRTFAASAAVTATNTVQGISIYRHDKTWTYPMPFISNPQIDVSAKQNAATSYANVADDITLTTATIRTDGLQSPASYSLVHVVRAIGRWLP